MQKREAPPVPDEAARRTDRSPGDEPLRRPTAAALLVAYLLVLIDLTQFHFLKSHPAPNLTPFRSIARDMHAGSAGFLVNFVGNLVAFLPFGVLPPLVWPARSSAWRVVAAAVLSGSIEVAQYASGRRTADVDDVILNVTGALTGYAGFAVVRGRRVVNVVPGTRSPT